MFPNLNCFAIVSTESKLTFDKKFITTLPVDTLEELDITMKFNKEQEFRETTFDYLLPMKFKKLKRIQFIGFKMSSVVFNTVFGRYSLCLLKRLIITVMEFDDNDKFVDTIFHMNGLEKMRLRYIKNLKSKDFLKKNMSLASSSLNQFELIGYEGEMGYLGHKKTQNCKIFDNTKELLNMSLGGVTIDVKCIPDSVTTLRTICCEIQHKYFGKLPNLHDLTLYECTILLPFRDDETKNSRIVHEIFERLTRLSIGKSEIDDGSTMEIIDTIDILLQYVPSRLRSLVISSPEDRWTEKDAGFIHLKTLLKLPCREFVRKLVITGWCRFHLQELEDADFSFFSKVEYLEIRELGEIETETKVLEKKILKKLKNPSCIVHVSKKKK